MFESPAAVSLTGTGAGTGAGAGTGRCPRRLVAHRHECMITMMEMA